MNLSAENIGAIRELVRNGYPLKARDAKDLLGHNDHLVELLEARGRLMLGVEIERDQLRAEVAGLRTGYEAYEQVNAELKAENEALRKDAERWRFFSVLANDLQAFPHAWGKMTPEKMDAMCDQAMADAAMSQGEQS